MRLFVVESTVVAIHRVATCLTDIAELHFIAAKVDNIGYPVVLVFIYKFCHTSTIPHDNGFLQTCLSQILRNAPLPPIIFNGGSGSWNQTFVVTVI